jgi:signal transduction histidine kinase
MITVERVDVSHLVTEIVQETALAVDSKQMQVINYLPQGIIVNGNHSLIYSIFRNLMDNAINYAGNGAVVTINAQDDDRRWRFVFADNGTGIAQEHLSRILSASIVWTRGAAVRWVAPDWVLPSSRMLSCYMAVQLKHTPPQVADCALSSP